MDVANPYQQQVFHRKLVYLGVVVGLLAVAWGFRTYAIEPRANELLLLEQTRGDVELLGAAARTALTGTRGFAVCFLWMDAQKQQKKNQWTALERTVKQVTSLQPHLVVPWLFQTWNLAYNVSRSCDRVADKYFYIVRGIQLLAQGERQNRFQPTLRRDVGYYHQHKISQSDETNTHRSLFQLSCIPPKDRDPEWFRDIREARRVDVSGTINLDRLEEFCKQHPQLARRLHSPPLPYDLRREHPKFRCKSAAEVVQFLEDNRDVPSLFVERLESAQGWEARARKKDPLDRFPVLPPERGGKFDDRDLTAEYLEDHPAPDEMDGFTVGRFWYGYAQECLPPPGDVPGNSQPIRDRGRQRIPRNMATTIFRSGPAVVRKLYAERLQEEGWYDDEPFPLTGWFQRGGGVDNPVIIGERNRQWSQEAWRETEKAWEKFGLANHLLFADEAQRANKERLMRAFGERLKLSPNQMAPEIKPESMDSEMKEQKEAWEFMRNYEVERHITNFEHFQMRSKVEVQPRTITARKLFYQAEQLRLVAQALHEALEKYEDPRALKAWREVLEDNPDFHNDDAIQEDTFEVELRYLRLYRRLNGDKLDPDLALLAALGQTTAGTPLGADWTLLGVFSRPHLQPEFRLTGPLDRDSAGRPLIKPGVKEHILVQRGLKKAPKPGTPSPAGTPAAAQPGSVSKPQ
jgi:hypothetical protein